MAGESARQLAQRQRAKAERLTRSATLWERGADGEEATANALAQLPKETWTVLHDGKWPGRPYANVDHIVVGPPGVFVIDSKNWSGQVAVKEGVLRQNGRSREKYVAAAAEAGLAVARLVPLLEPRLVHPVLCFVRDDELSGWVRDVMVCSTSNVITMLTSRSAVLAEPEVNQLCLDLDLGLREAGLAAPAVASGGRVSYRRSSAVPAGERRATASRSRKRYSSRSNLVGAVAGLAFAAVLIFRPDVLTGLADDVSGLIVDQPTTDKSDRSRTSSARSRRTRTAADPRTGSNVRRTEKAKNSLVSACVNAESSSYPVPNGPNGPARLDSELIPEGDGPRSFHAAGLNLH